MGIFRINSVGCAIWNIDIALNAMRPAQMAGLIHVISSFYYGNNTPLYLFTSISGIVDL